MLAGNSDRPNIIVILADDLGYSDIGCFGGEIDTPNLDRLAADGLRFTQFNNTSRCCPSRASLLTGLYSHQAGIGMMVYRDFGEGYRGNLNDRCVTFAQVLALAGYRTMLVGKWHAGHREASRPEVRGFEHFTGIYPHIDSYWKVLPSCDIYRDGRRFIAAGEDPVNPYRPDEEFYTTDFFTDVALDYIDRAVKEPSRPFLLHACYNVPHFPLEAPEALIEKYRRHGLGTPQSGRGPWRINKRPRPKRRPGRATPPRVAPLGRVEQRAPLPGRPSPTQPQPLPKTVDIRAHHGGVSLQARIRGVNPCFQRRYGHAFGNRNDTGCLARDADPPTDREGG